MFKRRIKYLYRSLSNMTQKKECPNCSSTGLREIDHKYFITTLYKCNQCGLNHRHPKDSAKWLDQFYQHEYEIDTHMMTDLPSDSEIEKHKSENFESLRGYDDYLKILFKEEAVRIIDYGCSWGYNVYRLNQAGHEAVGYEVSRPRAEFGASKLNISIYHEEEGVPGEQDLLLSSHVIEHLIDLPAFFDYSRSRLKKDGLFMAFCPNGNAEYRKREPETWHGSWGDIYVSLLDLDFAKHAFRNHPYLIMSGDWRFNLDEISSWDGKSQVQGEKLDGKELLIIAKPNIHI